MLISHLSSAYAFIEKGIRSSRGGRRSCISVLFTVFMHLFVCIPYFHVYIFLSAAMQTDVFTELSKTTPLGSFFSLG